MRPRNFEFRPLSEPRIPREWRTVAAVRRAFLVCPINSYPDPNENSALAQKEQVVVLTFWSYRCDLAS